MIMSLDKVVTWRVVGQPLTLAPMRWLAALVLIATVVFPTGRVTSVDLCPVHRWSGLPCPGCGVTRGLLHLSHGEWREALGANPWSALVWLVVLVMAVSVVIPAARVERFEALMARLEPWPSRVVRALFVAFFGFGLLRLAYFASSGEWFP